MSVAWLGAADFEMGLFQFDSDDGAAERVTLGASVGRSSTISGLASAVLGTGVSSGSSVTGAGGAVGAGSGAWLRTVGWLLGTGSAVGRAAVGLGGGGATVTVAVALTLGVGGTVAAAAAPPDASEPARSAVATPTTASASATAVKTVRYTGEDKVIAAFRRAQSPSHGSIDSPVVCYTRPDPATPDVPVASLATGNQALFSGGNATWILRTFPRPTT